MDVAPGMQVWAGDRWRRTAAGLEAKGGTVVEVCETLDEETGELTRGYRVINSSLVWAFLRYDEIAVVEPANSRALNSLRHRLAERIAFVSTARPRTGNSTKEVDRLLWALWRLFGADNPWDAGRPGIPCEDRPTGGPVNISALVD